jgi:hypothetical protein
VKWQISYGPRTQQTKQHFYYDGANGMNTIELAEYLIMMDGGATVLCERHREAFEHINTAMNRTYEVYAMEDDEDPISCQACHLAGVKANQTHH